MVPFGSQPTYEELKRSTRFGDLCRIGCSQPTYEELKPLFCISA
mgnify:CR=1 FL=1